MPKRTASKSGDLSEQIVALKDAGGKTWAQIAEEVGTTAGKAMFLYECASVTPSQRITAKNDDELKKKIAAARSKEKMSWGTLAARTGKSPAWCRKAYEEITGKASRGDRIGKGGRRPAEDSTPRTAAKPGAKKAPAKKAAGVKKAAKSRPPKKAAKKAAA